MLKFNLFTPVWIQKHLITNNLLSSHFHRFSYTWSDRHQVSSSLSFYLQLLHFSFKDLSTKLSALKILVMEGPRTWVLYSTRGMFLYVSIL